MYRQLHKSFSALFLLIMVTGCSTLAQTEIVLSSRWFHPRDAKDTLSTIKMVKDFGVTRVDWMYCNDKQQLKQLQDLHIPYSLAINPQTPDSAGYTTPKTRILDINGNPLTAPWMKSWTIKNPYWGCVNNPLFRDVFYRNTKALVDLGAYGIFVDDARFNDHALDWGGCYCSYCVSAFAKFLVAKKAGSDENLNYRNYVLRHADEKDAETQQYKKYFREFQTQSVIEFLTRWKKDLSVYAGRSVKFLTNNYNGNWDSPVYRVFDGGISEIPTDRSFSEERLRSIIEQADKLGKSQVFSFVSNDPDANVSFILSAYLNGKAALIPWDALVTEDVQQNKKRYYQHTETYRELFSFIRNSAPLFSAQSRQVVYKNIILTVPEGCNAVVRKFRKEYYVLIYSDYLKNQKTPGEVHVEIIAGKAIKEPVSVIKGLNKPKIVHAGNNKWSVLAESAVIKLGSL